MSAHNRFFMITSITLITLLALGGSVLAASNFPDANNHWAEDEIEYLENLGLVSGLPDGTYGVGNPITRAQVAQLIANEQGLASTPAPYPDVPAGHWGSGAIGAVTAAGLMGGFPDGTFRPDDYLTRAQAATVLANAYQTSASPASPTFPDVPIGHWAYAAVEGLVADFVAAGYPDGTFAPNTDVTRAEFAVFLARVLEPTFTTPLQLLAKTQDVVTALDAEDMDAFSDFVHPTLGVRFSPYSYVLSSHLVFTASAVENLLTDPTVYNWGTEDGTGDPIMKTPQEYFDRYVIDKDYTSPDDIQYNNVVQRGSMLVNIPTFYPNGIFVEYYVEGTAQYVGMDWGSLYVVFEEDGGDWYVVGIVHGEWTT